MMLLAKNHINMFEYVCVQSLEFGPFLDTKKLHLQKNLIYRIFQKNTQN